MKRPHAQTIKQKLDFIQSFKRHLNTILYSYHQLVSTKLTRRGDFKIERLKLTLTLTLSRLHSRQTVSDTFVHFFNLFFLTVFLTLGIIPIGPANILCFVSYFTNYLLTESEVFTGKSRTETLPY